MFSTLAQRCASVINSAKRAKELATVPLVRAGAYKKVGAASAQRPQLPSASWACGCGLQVWASECFQCGSDRYEGLTALVEVVSPRPRPVKAVPRKKPNITESVALLRKFILAKQAEKLQRDLSPSLSDEGQGALRSFQEVHPEDYRAIKFAGGFKTVAQDFPHMVSFEPTGALSAPPSSEQARLKKLKKTPIMLCDAFVKNGGQVVNFDKFYSDFGVANKPAAV